MVAKKKIVVKEEDTENENTKTENIDHDKKEVEEITKVINDEDKKQEEAEDLDNIADDNVEANVACEGTFTMKTVAAYIKDVHDGSMIQDLNDHLKMTKEEQIQALRVKI